MEKMLKRLNSQKGFTLAELLIVVAIIAVLVAVSIPVFNNQLEKAREATDAANIRNAIAEVTVQYLSADDPAEAGYSSVVQLTQKTDGWATAPTFTDSKGAAITGTPGTPGTPKASGTATVKISKAGVLSVEFSS